MAGGERAGTVAPGAGGGSRERLRLRCQLTVALEQDRPTALVLVQQAAVLEMRHQLRFALRIQT